MNFVNIRMHGAKEKNIFTFLVKKIVKNVVNWVCQKKLFVF